MGLEILLLFLKKQFNCKLTAQVQKVKPNRFINPWQFVGKELSVVLKEHSCASQISAQLCAAELAHKKSKPEAIALYISQVREEILL